MGLSRWPPTSTRMIADQERKSISDGNKKRALAIPEAPWKWFTSYELGFPLLTDEHERPMHPLVEVFVDDQLEAYWSEAEEATVPLPPLIGRLQTMKVGWGDQGCTKPPTSVDRVTLRERFSNSHIARNPMKLPEIVLDEDFLSMIQNPPEVGAVRIHMDNWDLGSQEILSSLRTFTNEAERTLDLPRRRSRQGTSPWLST